MPIDRSRDYLYGAVMHSFHAVERARNEAARQNAEGVEEDLFDITQELLRVASDCCTRRAQARLAVFKKREGPTASA